MRKSEAGLHAPANPPPLSHSARWLAAHVALALILSFALYGRTLDYSFAMDDNHYILDNQAVVHGASIKAFFTDPTTISSERIYQDQSWRPLRTLLFRAVAVIAGVRPAPFRALSIVLYALVAVATLVLARRLTGDAWASAVAALVWLVAPVHGEAIVYASASGDLVALGLELCALGAGLRAIGGARPLAWGLLSSLLLAASMLVKEMAATEPARLALVAAVLFGAGTLWRRRTLLILGTHSAIVLAYLALRTLVLHTLGHSPMTGGSIATALAGAPLLLGEYLRISVALFGHSPAYGAPPPLSALSIALPTLALVAVGWLVVRSRRPGLTVGAPWFVLTLLPVLQIIPVACSYADRYVLGASIGLATALAAGLAALPSSFRRGATMAMAAVVIILAAASWLESSAWVSESMLWRVAVDLEPEAGLAHGNLGAILFDEGRIAEAITELARAESLGQRQPGLELRRAMALEALGRSDEELALLEHDVLGYRPWGEGHALLGGLLARRGDLPRARHELAIAQTEAPMALLTLTLEADLAFREGRPAVARFGRLAASAPENVRWRYLQARASLAAGDAQGAVAAARGCLALAPTQAQCLGLLGRALTLSGTDGVEAREALERAFAALPPGSERDACGSALSNANVKVTP